MDEEKAKSFLRLIKRSQRGHLKIYLGYCAGVGKTYRMLQEAQALRHESIDVAIGFVETHGRAETAALLAGLEVIPRVVKQYKGIQAEEMDIDAVLARRPAVVLVDELAHTNVPGSRNLKRYQDVEEIIAAGIHVITTLNIQHIESLYDTVEKFVGVKVRERLPDTIIAEADQIINIDMSSEDLRKRLEEGKIYPKDRIEKALNNFFIPENLENLRELTLRELAAQIDSRRKEPTPEETAAIPDQVMVCLSSGGPNSDFLLRYASRFAGRLNKNWYALYVQRKAEDPIHIDARTQTNLMNTLTLAKQLGAIVFTYKGEDLASTIIRFAREYHVGHIIIGKPAAARAYKKWLRPKSLSQSLIQAALGMNIVVVDTATRELPSSASSLQNGIERPRKVTLSDFLSEKNILIWKEVALKEEVLRNLAMVACNQADDHLTIFNLLQAREKESSTFFNEGVAFPHLRLPGDFAPKLALAIIPDGIADLTTALPIKLVFLFLTSADQVDVQARLLAIASKMAGNTGFINALLASKEAAVILDKIRTWEASFL